MAGYNSVPLGEAGTGVAYLLGGSKALQRWMQRDDENAQIRKYNKTQELQRRDQANKNYNANQIKGVPNQYWNAELNKYLNNWKEIGAKYMSQGFDPFNPNPNDQGQIEASQQFMQDKSAIEQMMEAQKGFAKDIDQRDTDLKKDPLGYEDDGFNAFDFEKNTSLLDLSQGKASMPKLTARFDRKKEIFDAIPEMAITEKGIKKNPDGSFSEVEEKKVNFDRLEKHVDNVLLGGGRPTAYLEKKIGGSVSGLLKTTDRNKIRETLLNEFKSPTDNNPIIELKMQGKIPSFDSPEFEKFLEDATDEQLKAEKIYDEERAKAIQDGASKVDPSYSNKPYFEFSKEARAKRDQQIQEENLKINRAKASAKNETPQTVRDVRVDKIFSADALETDKLQAEVLANPKFGNKPLKIDTKKDGSGIMIFHVPDKVKTSAYDVAVQGYDVEIDPKNPAHKNKLNQLISDVTGETVASGNYEGIKGNKNKAKEQVSAKYSSAQEALIKKNMSANPSYSRAEIIKALGL